MRDFVRYAGTVVVAAVVGIGASLGTVLAMRYRAPEPLHESIKTSPRAAINLGRPPSTAAIVEPTDPKPNGARESVETALRYISCQQRAAEPPATPNSPDEAYEVDPTGGLAARLTRQNADLDAHCHLVGPTEYRQIPTLLQTAAAAGNRDAKSLVLRHRADALMSTAATAVDSTQTSDLPHIDEGEARAVADGLRKLALSGHRDSIFALQQLLSSTMLPWSDPIEAAAWRLVSYQIPGAPFPDEDKLPGRVDVFDEMNDDARQAVLIKARALFEQCCKG